MGLHTGGTVNGFGLMALRLSLAAVFIAHGTHKLVGLFAGPGTGMGGPEPVLALSIAIGAVETLGGLLLIFGWLTRLAAPALAATTAFALWKMPLPWGTFLSSLGAADGTAMEFHVVLIGGLLCLALTGAGEWSIDGSRAKSAAQREAGRARLRGRI